MIVYNPRQSHWIEVHISSITIFYFAYTQEFTATLTVELITIIHGENFTNRKQTYRDKNKELS